MCFPIKPCGVNGLEEFPLTDGGVKANTIEEGDAKAHEESDDDEAKAGAEGVNESEPVNPTLSTKTGR